MGLFTFVIEIVLHQDYAAHVARAALDNEDIPSDITPGELAEKTPGEATKVLRRFRQPLLQMVFCRIVDNFTAYLSDVIREVLHSRPDVLRSGEQVRLDRVLSYESIDDFTRDLIERKVTDLSYIGFKQLVEWFNNRLGVDLTQDADETGVVVEALETRNSVVHNRAIVGEKYLRNVQYPQFEIGDLRKLDVEYVFKVTKSLVSLVNNTDESIAKKFDLQRKLLEGVNVDKTNTKEV
jgi:hypothetical protein